tara:strand:+ start:334 stop:561 length:228 start_codon:yes stop_codon:yes gene_type:complete
MRLNLKSEKDLKTCLRLAMYREKIDKKTLAEVLQWSYPTMLKYLKHPEELSIKKLKSICRVLDIDFSKTLNKTEL